MTLTLHEFGERVFGRAVIYLLKPFDLTMEQAKARAAREIASEYRIKNARLKKRAPVMSMPAPAPDDSGVESVRLPTKPAMHSNVKPATCSDPKPAGVPI
jgi:hypothetical protein